MKVDARKAAELAMIEMSEEELEKLQKDIDEMMEMLKELLEMDLKDVEPLYHASNVENVAREDVPKKWEEEWLYLVPHKEGRYVKAPRPY